MNLLVLPTVSVVLVSGIAAIVVGMASVGVAVYVVLPGRVLLFLYEKSLRTGSRNSVLYMDRRKSGAVAMCRILCITVFWGVGILGMSRGTVAWNGATGKRAGNHAFMQEKKESWGRKKDG